VTDQPLFPYVVEPQLRKAFDLREKDASMVRYGFLWASYEPRCWWFECLEAVRRLLLAGMLVLCYPGSISQILVGMVIAFLSSRVFTYFSPFVSKWQEYVTERNSVVRAKHPFLTLPVIMTGSLLMDYTQWATVLTLSLTLWLKLDGDKYSVLLGGHIGLMIVLVNVSTLVVMTFTTYMQVTLPFSYTFSCSVQSGTWLFALFHRSCSSQTLRHQVRETLRDIDLRKQLEAMASSRAAAEGAQALRRLFARAGTWKASLRVNPRSGSWRIPSPPLKSPGTRQETGRASFFRRPHHPHLAVQDAGEEHLASDHQASI
jgi:hypothetical protein